MAYSMAIQYGAQVSGYSTTYAKSVTGSGSTIVMLEETITTGQTDFEITCPDIDVSAVTAFWLNSSQAVSFETNAADHTGGNIIALRADEPYVWHTNSYDTFKLTEDVETNLFITNSSGATATLTLIAVMDATPE